MKRLISVAAAVLVVGALGCKDDSAERITAGFDALHHEQQRNIDAIREKNAELEIDIIDEARQGYAHLTADELKKYIDDLTWVRSRVDPSTPHGPAALHEVDRDLAWCKKQLDRKQNGKH